MTHNAKGITQSAERLIRRLPQYHLPELQGERGKAQINADWRVVDGIKSWRETMKWEALRHWVQLQNLSWREAGHCAKSEIELVRNEFLRIWPKFQWIRVNEELMQQAGELIFEHSLRGFDAVHLASALLLKQEDGAIDLFFSSFDHNLNRAAREKGLLTHEL